MPITHKYVFNIIQEARMALTRCVTVTDYSVLIFPVLNFDASTQISYGVTKLYLIWLIYDLIIF